jgi:O-glycosyl hydrolase
MLRLVKARLLRVVLKTISALLIICSAHADVTVTQNLAPGATTWPGNPIIQTLANPSAATIGEDFSGGGGNTNLSETFTVTTTNYTLQSIDLYAGGGSGTAPGSPITLNLYDLGLQSAPNPSPYTISISSVNLLGGGAGLSINYSNQPNGLVEFDFTGPDQVYLQAGHMYAFELTGPFNSSLMLWLRTTSDTYAGGAAYRNQSWINGNSARDFALAVYASVNTNPPPPLPPAQCTVDWNDVHQRIDGFGASSAWRSTWTTNQANMFFSTNDVGTNVCIGLSLLRSRVAPGGSTVEQSIMQMAQARGAKVWSTPWSPQASFKDSGTVNGGNYVSANNQAYANQLAGYVASMKQLYGVDIYALSIQNEPDVNTTNYESCVWNSQQFHDFVPYLYNALQANNAGNTKIILAESEHWSFNLATNTLNDPTTLGMIGVLAGHNYGSSAAPVNNQGKALWETEVSLLSGNDSSISNGLYWAGQIHSFLTIAQVNAWHHWWLITGNSTGNQGLLDINGTPAKRMYVLGNYSRFVRPNFYRIGVSSRIPALLVTAYKDPGSGRFVIVAANPTPSPISEIFNFTGFTSGMVTPWVTSATQSLASNAPVVVASSSFTNTIDAMSVVTFVGQSDPPPPLVGWGNNDSDQSQVPPYLSNSVAMAAGGYHSLFLQSNGTIVALGDDSSGQCNVPPGLSNVVAVAGGSYHSLALRSDGAVFAWGDDSSGQCDIPANATNVVAISAGTWHSLALRADGSVVAWGDDSWNQSDVPAGASNVVAISAGGYHNLALKSDCSVIAWGSDTSGFGTYSGQAQVPAGLAQVVAVAAGGYHSLALRAGGTVVAWGDNSYGQSGVPSVTNAVAIAAGDAHSLALKTDGSVAAWGNNFYGQCSISSNLTGVVAIAAGGTHSLTLRGPAPIGPVLSASRPGRNSFALSLPTIRGKAYFLQYKNSLNAPNWSFGPALVGNGSARSWTSTLTNSPSGYFRVRQEL